MSDMQTRGKKTKPTQDFHGAYFFRAKEQDPIVDSIRTMMSDTGLDAAEIHERGGPTAQTIKRWVDGKTHCPQFRTIAAAGRAMGFQMGWHPVKHKPNGQDWSAKAAPILKQFLRGY